MIILSICHTNPLFNFYLLYIFPSSVEYYNGIHHFSISSQWSEPMRTPHRPYQSCDNLYNTVIPCTISQEYFLLWILSYNIGGCMRAHCAAKMAEQIVKTVTGYYYQERISYVAACTPGIPRYVALMTYKQQTTLLLLHPLKAIHTWSVGLARMQWQCLCRAGVAQQHNCKRMFICGWIHQNCGSPRMQYRITHTPTLICWSLAAPATLCHCMCIIVIHILHSVKNYLSFRKCSYIDSLCPYLLFT